MDQLIEISEKLLQALEKKKFHPEGKLKSCLSKMKEINY